MLLFDPGIWAGMHTVRYFDGKTYEWVGLSRQPSIMGKVCSLKIHYRQIVSPSYSWVVFS